jgi:N-acylglucosamine-6-phosphate 2-epimerase
MNLDALRGGLIVSVQAPGSLLNEPATIALLARVAEENGAVAVRIEGGARIGAVRRAVRIPVIGLVKREYPGFAPYITPTEREIAEVIAAGADIVAFDATGRARPHGHGTHALVHAIRRRSSWYARSRRPARLRSPKAASARQATCGRRSPPAPRRSWWGRR